MNAPEREEMTLLWGRDDREIRAAIVEGRLLILVYDQYGEAGLNDWHPDPECGVFLPPDGLAALRTLLASTDRDDCGERTAVVGRWCGECEET